MTEKENLLQRLARQQTLTASERKLALFFEENYPRIAFSNLAELSVHTDVSKATVTRFVRRLGYANFHYFIRSLREDVAQNFDSPLERYAQDKLAGQLASEVLLKRHIEFSILDLQRTLEHMDWVCFERVQQLVRNPDRPLYLMSVATGQTLLHYFYLLSKYLRGNVHLLDGDSSTLPHRMVDAGSDAILFVIAIDRHPRASMKLLRFFHDMGNETILLTNRRSSPLAQYARHELHIHTERHAIFKSRCSALVILETLISSMAIERQPAIDHRHEFMDKLFKELDVFVQI